MNPTRHSMGILILLVAAGFPCAGAANDSSLQDGAYGPEPVGGTNGPESIVAMTEEKLEFRVGRKETRVVAKFTFVSRKESGDAVQLVGFPDFGAGAREAKRRKLESGMYDSDMAGPIRDMTTEVDGVPAASELKYGFVKWQEEGPWRIARLPGETGKSKPPADADLMAWHVLTVKFPPGKPVTITRRYRVGNGQTAGEGHKFYYTTATGGVWNGSIGKLTADVTLLDGLKAGKLMWSKPAAPGEYEPGSKPPRGDWEELSPDRLRLVWEDFEPRTQKDRRTIEIVIPYTKGELD